ncbi:MAG: alpha-amylase [Lachnospiraceae bacterium]|nr:alpha-amylase [Candidatus Equihabitans merdae]
MAKWYEQAVFYHIYPLGLTGAPFNNDCLGKSAEELAKPHRFEELFDWIPHIAELGCTAIYIGPLFESGTHGYDTIDYKKVDSRLGTNEDFIEFVKRAHAAGIKVVVDGVFNHTGRGVFAFEDLRVNRENSPYRYWYRDVSFEGNTCFNDGFWYQAWHNIHDLPALNQWNEDVRQYIFSVIRFWIHEFDIDGIRLDSADCLDFNFLRDICSVARYEKEDFWMMGELIHGDYARWINGGLLDSSTNYELHKGLFSGHNDHNYFEIAHSIRRQFDANGGIYKGMHLYTFVDNHDVDRLASKLNEKAHLPLVWTLLFTLPGIPAIYYGSEWGIEGRKNGPDDSPMRPRLILSEMEANPPVPGLAEFISKLAALKKEDLALTYGRYQELLLTNRQYAYARILDDHAVVVAANNDPNPAEMWFNCPLCRGNAKLEDVLKKDVCQDAGDSQACDLDGEILDGRIHVAIPGHTVRVFMI